MLRGPFLSKDWIGAVENYDEADWVLLGVPFDGTCSYRPGSRFAPEEIRLASWGLEEYSPLVKRELSEVPFFDGGELGFPFGNKESTLQIIKENVQDILSDNKKYFGVGGEHLVTLPAIEAYKEKYPELGVIHFDAHTDLRDEYLDEKLSHATVIRRVSELVSPENLTQIGIRSGEKTEFDWMKEHGTFIDNIESAKKKLSKLKDNNIPVFITVDLDVMDPSIFPGTGTPEAGGMSYEELMMWFLALRDLNVVGIDAVELAPHYDKSGVSTAVAAKVIREMLLIFG